MSSAIIAATFVTTGLAFDINLDSPIKSNLIKVRFVSAMSDLASTASTTTFFNVFYGLNLELRLRRR